MDVFTRNQKLEAVRSAENSGTVADNIDVRMHLIRRMEAGEITFDHLQAELARIKRDAKKNGMTTRSRVFRES